MFTALFGMLVFRNRFVFGTPIHELGDSGANSIIIAQAKHFDLLVGNYSRQGFSHPGPAYFYVQAFGEWLFHDLLGLVPTPWNGQILAIYALNAGLLATVTVIIGRWTESWFTAITCLLAVLALISLEPKILTDAWMPFVYVPSFLLLLVAAASVAAGRSADLWAIALAGGLLVHGHASFLLFVPLIAAVAAIWLVRKHGFDRQASAIALGVLAVFLAPIVINTILHWPGEFAKYFGYGSSSGAGSKSVMGSLAYVFWYWWPGIPLLGAALAAVVMIALTRFKHPFVRAGLWLSAIVTLLLAYYAYAGVDKLEDPYMGFFSWSVPLFAVIGLTMWASTRRPHMTVVVPAVAAVAVLALVPGFRTFPNDDYPTVPKTLQALKSHAAGRPVVVEVAADTIGPELAGLALWARRDGFRLCLRDARWSFMTTPEYICTAAEVGQGVVVSRWHIEPTSPLKEGEIARTGTSAFLSMPADLNQMG